MDQPGAAVNQWHNTAHGQGEVHFRYSTVAFEEGPKKLSHQSHLSPLSHLRVLAWTMRPIGSLSGYGLERSLCWSKFEGLRPITTEAASRIATTETTAVGERRDGEGSKNIHRYVRMLLIYKDLTKNEPKRT
jgi:hypothetical protein